MGYSIYRTVLFHANVQLRMDRSAKLTDEHKDRQERLKPPFLINYS